VRTTTSYTVSGLVNGTRYYFRVLAKNAIGFRAASNVVSQIPRPAAPTAPRTLTATPGSGQVRLSWLLPASNGGAVVTDYIIQRSANGTSGWVTISDGVRTTTSYTVTGLVNGTRYYFRVLAKNATGSSPASNVVNAIPRTVPGAPSGLRATPRLRSVTLTWNAPATGGAPITDYIIQRSTNGTTWTTVTDGLSTARTYTVTGLSSGVTYRFRVAARNAAGIGAYSAVVTGRPT
jgi:titin